MATGSYEGSPLMEGTLDHHEPSTFTSRRSRWSWRLPHTSKAHAPPTEAGERREGEGLLTLMEEGEATGVSEARSYEGSVGRQRPRSRHHSGEIQTWAARGFGGSTPKATGPVDPPKRFERRENARASGQAASSPNSVGRPRGETRGSERRKHTRCRVHAVRTGSRSRSDASRVLYAGRSQVLVAIHTGR